MEMAGDIAAAGDEPEPAFDDYEAKERAEAEARERAAAAERKKADAALRAKAATRFLENSAVGKADMIQLANLESDSLMDNLYRRFLAEIVYTYIGDIVVSVNPFKLTGNSEPRVQQRYVHALQVNEPSTKLPPHIYTMVGQCYAKMRTLGAKSLSILISGESGAGKTEAMKLCVSHLGAVSSVGREKKGAAGNVAQRLMATNPIMEPIGNAKTVRNNNSSRFGKHFDIQFDHHGQIIGALTSVYLLEKPRICMHMKGERNYHVFYMLCKADASVRKDGCLGSWEEYRYLKQEGTVERVTSWDDYEEFDAMHAALFELGFTKDSKGNDLRAQLYLMIAIVLHLGNMSFRDKADGDGSEVINEDQLKLCAGLLQVEVSLLREALTREVIMFGNDEITKDLAARRASAMCNSLGMHIYLLAFEWCVKKINASISVPPSEVHRCIGVLDIFGFENFDLNSFPQLCINLTNERLHHLFIEHIFEVEQRFYESEDIEWTPVAYDDNKHIIDLITKKPGIFSLINDAGKGSSTDEALCQNLHEAFDKAPWKDRTYSKPKKPRTFMIHHYAGTVSYSIEGFIEKNKDELSISVKAIVEKETGFEPLRDLAQAFRKRMETAVLDKQAAKASAGGKKGGGKRGGGPSTRQKTVSESFGESLQMLMDKLTVTDHRYIRCLKPNQTLVPGDWNADLMLKQLAYSGTLEVTKVRKAGLNVRWELPKFYEWYKICAKRLKELRAPSMREQCVLLLKQIELDPKTWRVGRTIVFMASHDVVGELDRIRDQRVSAYAAVVQGAWRMGGYRKMFQEKRKAARRIQHHFRMVRIRNAYRYVRGKALIIQRVALVHIARQRVEDIRDDPGLLTVHVPDVDEMVNSDTGSALSLTMAIALSTMSNNEVKTAEAKTKKLNREEAAKLDQARTELAHSPDRLVEEATDAQLFTAVYTALKWKHAGVDVLRKGGREGARPDAPAVPKFTRHGGALGWMSVRVEQLDETDDVSPDELAEAMGGDRASRRSTGASSSSSSSKRAGRRTAESVEATSDDSTAIERKPASFTAVQKDMYAILKQGTLILEEPIGDDSSERRVFGVYPTTLMRTFGTWPAGFTRADVGRQVTVMDVKVSDGNSNDGALQQAPENKTLVSCGKTALVDGESRQFAETVRIEVTTTLEEEGFANLKPTQATDPLTIESVDEWVGGLITLRDPKKKKRRFACFNVAPANVPKDSLRFTIGHKCTVLWEGRQVKFRSDDAEEDGSAQETTGLLSSLMGKLSFRRASKGKAATEKEAVDATPVVEAKPVVKAAPVVSEAPPSLSKAKSLWGKAKERVTEDRSASSVWDGDADADDDFRASRRSMLRHSELEAEDEAAGIVVDASVLRGSLAERQLEAPVRQRLSFGLPMQADHQQQRAPNSSPLANTTGAESFIKKLRDVLAEAVHESRVVDAFYINPNWEQELESALEEDARKQQEAAAHRQSRAAPSPGAAQNGAPTAKGNDDRKSHTPASSGHPAPDPPPTDATVATSYVDTIDGEGAMAVASRKFGTVKQGFLLRKLRHDSEWGRRYFVLNHFGQLRWYMDAEAWDTAQKEMNMQMDRGASVSKAMAACDPHTYGQISLRFVAPELCGQLRAKDVECEVYEEPEVKRMLPSCVVFELHAGREVLRLAWHKSIVDEWLKELTAQCVINYQKSPIFSDRQLKIHWMDGVARSLTIGENTTAVDLVRRLCRARKTGGDSMPRGQSSARGGNMSARGRRLSFIGGDGSGAVPVIHDSSEWAIFERQRHVNRGAVSITADDGRGEHERHPSVGKGGWHMHKLPNNESMLNQLVLRWERASRKYYGAATNAPRGSFELRLRKVRASSVRARLTPEEEQLEFVQARDDLLDGRLRASLGKLETLELGAVLSLWEMHDRPPRPGAQGHRGMIKAMLQQKRKPPTLDFDILPEELRCVLPIEMWRTDEARATTHAELGARYRELLRKDMDKLDSNAPKPNDSTDGTGSSNNSSRGSLRTATRVFASADKKQGIFDASASGMAESALSSTQSRTYRHVMNVRNEAVGVTYDSDGRVVVDKSAAQRVIRLRLLEEPLSFGAVYTVRLWAGRGHALRLLNVAINQGGVHLYTWERAPLHVASISFIPNSHCTLLAWQLVEHHSEDDTLQANSAPAVAATDADSSDAALASHSSLILHVCTPVRGAGVRAMLAAGADEVSLGSARTSVAQLKVERGKLVLLTKEGSEMKESIDMYAQEQLAQRRAVLAKKELHPSSASPVGNRPTAPGRKTSATTGLMLAAGGGSKKSMEDFKKSQARKMSVFASHGALLSSE